MKIPYGKHWITDEDIKSVINILKGDWITQGPTVKKFEDAIANYVGAKYAVAFSSGTAALHGAMFAAGIKNGDEIISTPLSFVATTNSAIYLGAKIKFVDINPKTYCIDIDKVSEQITDKVKAIVPVDYAGYPVDIKQLREITEKHNVLIIEDAAHALGAKRYGNYVGKEADMTMFSFHPVKHITTGEGGVIVTNNEDYYDRLLLFRTHGITKDKKKFVFKSEGDWYYEMQELGFNYRITDIQSALGISQLSRIEYFIKRRNEIAEEYYEKLGNNEKLILPLKPPYPNSRHAFHIYPILLKEHSRKEVFDRLRKAGIGVQVHYIPIHYHPYYQHHFNYKRGDFPYTEDFYEREITIPLFPKMEKEEIEYVVEQLNYSLSSGQKL